MSNRTKIILVVFAGLILVGVGVFASILLIQRFQAEQPSSILEEETVKVDAVVLTRDMFLGNRIETNDVELASVPVEITPRDAVTSLEDAVGKIIKTDMIQGEMVLLHNLADPTNNNKDLSFILSEEHVLMAFPADDLMSRESVVQRGDIVDIFATFDLEIEPEEGAVTAAGEPEEPETKTFTLDSLQRVDVTAMVLEVIVEEETNTDLLPGQTAEGAPEQNYKIRAYLLALNPQDALVLKHLKDTGATFDIVIRVPTSTTQFELTPVTEEYIIEFYGLEILP